MKLSFNTPTKFNKNNLNHFMQIKKNKITQEHFVLMLFCLQIIYFNNEILRLTKSAKSLPFNMLFASKARSINCFTFS